MARVSGRRRRRRRWPAGAAVPKIWPIWKLVVAGAAVERVMALLSSTAKKSSPPRPLTTQAPVERGVVVDPLDAGADRGRAAQAVDGAVDEGHERRAIGRLAGDRRHAAEEEDVGAVGPDHGRLVDAVVGGAGVEDVDDVRAGGVGRRLHRVVVGALLPVERQRVQRRIVRCPQLVDEERRPRRRRRRSASRRRCTGLVEGGAVLAAVDVDLGAEQRGVEDEAVDVDVAEDHRLVGALARSAEVEQAAEAAGERHRRAEATGDRRQSGVGVGVRRRGGAERVGVGGVDGAGPGGWRRRGCRSCRRRRCRSWSGRRRRRRPRARCRAWPRCRCGWSSSCRARRAWCRGVAPSLTRLVPVDEEEEIFGAWSGAGWWAAHLVRVGDREANIALRGLGGEDGELVLGLGDEDAERGLGVEPAGTGAGRRRVDLEVVAEEADAAAGRRRRGRCGCRPR